MKKITLFILFLGILIIPLRLYADTGVTNPTSGTGVVNGGNSNATISNPLNVNSVGSFINSAVEIFSYIAVIVAVIMFIVVGLMYILARGNPQKLKDTSTWLLYIVIGVAIIIGARLMISVIINTLEATGAVNKNVIQSARDANSGQ